DPARGFLATANNDQLGNTRDNDPLNDPHYLYATDDLGYRHARIVERLAAVPALSLDDMTSIQADTKSLLARDLVPGLIGYFDDYPQTIASRGLKPAVDLLRAWDF